MGAEPASDHNGDTATPVPIDQDGETLPIVPRRYHHAGGRSARAEPAASDEPQGEAGHIGLGDANDTLQNRSSGISGKP
jgi:hypothetical protein